MKNKYEGMTPKVESYQKKESAYAERYTQSPTEYISRNNRMQDKEASQLRKQAYKGRYD